MGKNVNSNQWWNNEKCRCECKKNYICKKYDVWILLNVIVKIWKSLASIMDDSAIIFDEVIESYHEEIKTISTNFNEKKINCKAQSFCILLVFLLITVALLIAVSRYCYMIKYQAKQKHLLPFAQHEIETNLH